MSTNPVQAICRVHLLDTLYHIDKLYDYYIPEAFRGEVVVGGFVAVPFGKSSKRYLAFVEEVLSNTEVDRELKPILAIVHPGMNLDEEQRGLCHFLKEHTYCTIGDAVRCMLPTAAFSSLTLHYSPDPDGEEKLDSMNNRQLSIYHYILQLGSTTEGRLLQRFGEGIREALDEMVRLGAIYETLSGGATKEKTVTVYRLAVTEEQAARIITDGTLRGVKQVEALRLLLEAGQLTAAEMHSAGISKATCDSLVSRELLDCDEVSVWRDPMSQSEEEETQTPPLTADQEKAMEIIDPLLNSGEAKAVLLHGVTGSGKTRVMKEVIDRVISSGRSVILLVPEIALTPQTVSYFRSYYGDRTVVVHSMLSQGERYDAWRKMKSGAVDLCIGTRSAVFAPLPNLGAILIDEEQEHTYRSESTPKYHAIDVARYRCAHHHAMMLLASATPSFESYYKAKQGIYTLVTLANRASGGNLPAVTLADQRIDEQNGRLGCIGSELEKEITNTLCRGEQAILFVNRRGYNHFLSCPHCGEAVKCPHCSVSLTVHNVPRSSESMLRCHYCSHNQSVPKVCPSCGKPGLRQVGYGTQRAEEELYEIFPQARTVRMDADTTVGKMAYREILHGFRHGKADILLGTQMVTKGQDYPAVTLVGVLNADSVLYLNDYRASERAFSLMTQVIGRAGRGERAGCALIQTASPHHPLFELVKAQDYETFFHQEIALRRSLVFPPFCEIVTVTVSGSEEKAVCRIITALRQEMAEMQAQPEFQDLPMQIFGPMEAPIYRVNDIYRMRLVMKCRHNARMRKFLSTILVGSAKRYGRNIYIAVDVNPENT